MIKSPTHKLAALLSVEPGEGMMVLLPVMQYVLFGVIRGAMRNATVVAERGVALLMIPKETFLNHWHHPYSPAEFRQEIMRRAAEKGQLADILPTFKENHDRTT